MFALGRHTGDSAPLLREAARFTTDDPLAEFNGGQFWKQRFKAVEWLAEAAPTEPRALPLLEIGARVADGRVRFTARASLDGAGVRSDR